MQAARWRAYSSFPPKPIDCAGVDHERGAEVGFLLVELDVIAVAAGVGPPVDVAQFVAGHVFAVLGKLDAEAFVRAFVLPGDHPLDHLPGRELKLAHPGRVGGGEELIAMNGHELKTDESDG